MVLILGPHRVDEPSRALLHNGEGSAVLLALTVNQTEHLNSIQPGQVPLDADESKA